MIWGTDEERALRLIASLVAQIDWTLGISNRLDATGPNGQGTKDR